MGGCAWVTLVTNDTYGIGALVLAHTLRHAGTAHELVCLITPGVSMSMREKLAAIFNIVEEVDILDSRDEVNLRLLKRPELGITFTKLHCWKLTQYDKCVFLDADTMVLDSVDELFEREELSAAPDVGWPDCFNSGVFVYRPSMDTFLKLVEFALEKGSFDGGDQGLLNLYFSDWPHGDINKHLPFIYNMCSTATYSYLPAFKQYGLQAKIIHFIGNTKPWLFHIDKESNVPVIPHDMIHLQPLIEKWWSIFRFLIHPALTVDMTGLAATFSQLSFGISRTTEQTMLEDHFRRQSWETGNADYMGRDSFERVWGKICQTVDVATGPTQAYSSLPKESERAGLPGGDQKEPDESELRSNEKKLQEHGEELKSKVDLHLDESVGSSSSITVKSSSSVGNISDSDNKTLSTTTAEITDTVETTLTRDSSVHSESVLEKVTEKKQKPDNLKGLQPTLHTDEQTTTELPQSIQTISSTKEVISKEAVTKDSSTPADATSSEASATKPKSVPTKAPATTAPVAPPRKGGSSGGEKKKGGKGKK